MHVDKNNLGPSFIIGLGRGQSASWKFRAQSSFRQDLYMRIPILPHSPISINFHRGDYSGGWLWLDNGSKLGYAKNIRTQSCKHGLGNRSNQPNTSVDFPFSGRNKWFKFDGRKPHCVTPFSGRRYTLATWWMLWGKEKSQIWTYSMQKLIIIIYHYMCFTCIV